MGCSFTSEIVFDPKCIETLKKNLAKLSSSPLLKPDQKLNVINQYIFSKLTYHLQSVPLSKIPSYVTNGVDVMIRRTVKENRSTNESKWQHVLFYSPRRLRGLGLLRTSWEVHLQHFAIAKRLANVNDELFQSISDCKGEMDYCRQHLKVTGNSTKALKTMLRENCFNNWCDLKYQGSGAVHFKTCTSINDFVCNKNSLSSSEWTATIKLNCNYTNLNGVPDVQNSSALCRRCGKENESIAHVTGSCSWNNLLITARHHSFKNQMTKLMTEKDFDCHEEVYTVDTDGKSRFCDIVAFHKKSNQAYILDPTIRYETNDPKQDEKICKEKREIYEKCIEFLKEKYTAKYGIRWWKVIGLWVGSRGAAGSSVLNFFNNLKLPLSELKNISEQILSKTIHIINHHQPKIIKIKKKIL